jgi:S-formylglutathione hydrolase
MTISTASPDSILREQGLADGFLEPQQACDKAGQSVTINMREGYDHSYYFIASFIGDHLRFHAEALGA